MELSGRAGQDRIYHKMIPPEAFSTDQFSNRFDVYQVGMTLYRMCVGDAEFYNQYSAFLLSGQLDRDAFKFAVRNGRFPSRSKYPEHIPQALRNNIAKCLETDPTNRHSSAIDIVNQFASIDGQILDWQYAKSGEAREWTRTEGEKAWKLSVSNAGVSTATKRIGEASPRRISAYCLDRITKREIRRFLRGD